MNVHNKILLKWDCWMWLYRYRCLEVNLLLGIMKRESWRWVWWRRELKTLGWWFFRKCETQQVGKFWTAATWIKQHWIFPEKNGQYNDLGGLMETRGVTDVWLVFLNWLKLTLPLKKKRLKEWCQEIEIKSQKWKCSKARLKKKES